MLTTQPIPIESGTKVWLDALDPTEAELDRLGKDFGLHPAFLTDCLDPTHLPKYEEVDGTTFMIFRAFDLDCAKDSESIQQLTRKIALFITPRGVVTVHRSDQLYLKSLRDEWQANGRDRTQDYLINAIVDGVIASYQQLIDQIEEPLEQLEEQVFRGRESAALIEDSYHLKRMASVTERMIRMTEDVVSAMSRGKEYQSPFRRDLTDKSARLQFYIDDLQQRIDELLHLHLALETRRTNEVMRVLTLFSVFFLPLSFVAGVYGMNFKHMPELEWPFGYAFAVVLMAAIAATIWIWFRRKGWIGGTR